MKNRLLVTVLTSIITAGTAGLAADLPVSAKQVLQEQCDLDFDGTRRAQLSAGAISEIVYNEAPGLQIEVWLLRCRSNIDETFKQLRIPKDAELKAPKSQELNIVLSMMAGMFGDVLKSSFAPDWPDRAVAKAKSIAGQPMRSYKVAFEEPGKSGAAGSNRVKRLEIEGISPWMDYRTLELLPGNWVQVTQISWTEPVR